MRHVNLPPRQLQNRLPWMLVGTAAGTAIGFIVYIYQVEHYEVLQKLEMVFHLGMRATYILAGAAIGLVVGLATDLVFAVLRR